MLAFAAEGFNMLSRYARRVATGTTCQRLNELAWSRGWPKGQLWVDRYQSGPMGDDAQIASLVLEHRYQRVIFLEDPHVARQHEADIQLLERGDHARGRGCMHHFSGRGDTLDDGVAAALGATHMPSRQGCMCLITFGLNAHPRLHLVLAGNSENFHGQVGERFAS